MTQKMKTHDIIGMFSDKCMLKKFNKILNLPTLANSSKLIF